MQYHTMQYHTMQYHTMQVNGRDTVRTNPFSIRSTDGRNDDMEASYIYKNEKYAHLRWVTWLLAWLGRFHLSGCWCCSKVGYLVAGLVG